jgi:glycosyltransferase involved in cell wall biosynthesis
MKQKKRILFVIPSPAGGGAERVVCLLANHLISKYVVTVVFFKPPSTAERSLLDPSVAVLDLGKDSRWDILNMVRRLRAIYLHTRPHAVMSFLDFTNIMAVCAALGLKRNFRLIVNERNFPLKHLAGSRFGQVKLVLLRWAYNRADLVLCNSRQTKNSLERHFKIPPSKIDVVYNPISINEIQRRLREPIPEDYSGRFIIGVGRLNRQKRFDLLIKAYAEFKRTDKNNVKLVILGEGNLKEELTSLAQSLCLEKDIFFLGYKSNPYVWIAKAELFVLASDYEGFPNVILEAMACRTPVISTDCLSGPNEIITNGLNGILVPTDSPSRLAERITELMANDSLRESLAKEGSLRIKDFAVESLLPKYMSVFLD